MSKKAALLTFALPLFLAAGFLLANSDGVFADMRTFFSGAAEEVTLTFPPAQYSTDGGIENLVVNDMSSNSATDLIKWRCSGDTDSTGGGGQGYACNFSPTQKGKVLFSHITACDITAHKNLKQLRASGCVVDGFLLFRAQTPYASDGSGQRGRFGEIGWSLFPHGRLFVWVPVSSTPTPHQM